MSKLGLNSILTDDAPELARRRMMRPEGLGLVAGGTGLVAGAGGAIATGVAVMSFIGLVLGGLDDFSRGFIKPYVIPAVKLTALFGVSGLFVITVWNNFLRNESEA